MSEKAPDNKTGITKYYYLQVFHLFVSIHKKIWHHSRIYNNSPGGIAVIGITLVECLNIYALLKYVIFPNSRGCAACQYDVRLTILGLIGAAIWVLNMVTFFAEEEKQLPKLPHPKLFKRLVIAYTFISILLVL